MTINLLYEVFEKKLWQTHRSYTVRSTFYTETTLHKLLCKPKDGVAIEDKINIDYKIDCSKCKAVYFVNLKGL